jgi:hypothetical protein
MQHQPWRERYGGVADYTILVAHESSEEPSGRCPGLGAASRHGDRGDQGRHPRTVLGEILNGEHMGHVLRRKESDHR